MKRITYNVICGIILIFSRQMNNSTIFYRQLGAKWRLGWWDFSIIERSAALSRSTLHQASRLRTFDVTIKVGN